MHVLVNETGKKHMTCKYHNTFISRISYVRHWTTWISTVDFNSGFQPKRSKFRIKITTNFCFNISCRKTQGSLFSTGQGLLVRHQLGGVSSSTGATKVKPMFASLREHASKAMLMYLDLEFG